MSGFQNPSLLAETPASIRYPDDWRTISRRLKADSVHVLFGAFVRFR
jgi:hypothetical protein